MMLEATNQKPKTVIQDAGWPPLLLPIPGLLAARP
jgi:hypothetical protein